MILRGGPSDLCFPSRCTTSITSLSLSLMHGDTFPRILMTASLISSPSTSITPWIFRFHLREYLWSSATFSHSSLFWDCSFFNSFSRNVIFSLFSLIILCSWLTVSDKLSILFEVSSVARSMMDTLESVASCLVDRDWIAEKFRHGNVLLLFSPVDF